MCSSCKQAATVDRAVIEHPPGAETLWDWVELPDPPTRWGWISTAHVLIGAVTAFRALARLVGRVDRSAASGRGPGCGYPEAGRAEQAVRYDGRGSGRVGGQRLSTGQPAGEMTSRGVPDRDHSRQVETPGCQALPGRGQQVDSGGNVETGRPANHRFLGPGRRPPCGIQGSRQQSRAALDPRPDRRPGRHCRPSARTRHG